MNKPIVKEFVDLQIDDNHQWGTITAIINKAECAELSAAHLQMKRQNSPQTTEATRLYMVLEGEGTANIDNKKHHVRKGTIILVPPNIKHFLIPRSGKGMRVLVVGTPAYDPKKTKYED